MKQQARELTHMERKAIKKLVTKECANYDRDYGCLPLDCPCYMLGKWWTGAYCKYFQSAVLPLDPVLEAALLGFGPVLEAHACPVCGRAFVPQGKRTYCSPVCQYYADRQKACDRMRKKRSGGTG
ncbi:MAG: cysteine-rich VLP domain-containing protein [Oscillospiraceae bacterium]|nr:cysteine-rich VLP domain-containing protein [Oscillospiraceae bacterium]